MVLSLVKKALYFSTMKEKDATFCFRKEGILYPVKIRDITYMECVGRRINIHTSNGDVLAVPYITLKDILNEMDTDCMMQCSRNLVINKDYVENIDIPNRMITLKNVPGRMEIGKTFRKKVLGEYGL